MTRHSCKIEKDMAHTSFLRSNVPYLSSFILPLLFTFQPSLLRAQDTLSTSGKRMEEVVITASQAASRLTSVQIGAESIRVHELTSTPQLMGERDLMRSVQLLPGVKAESDASSSFQVRGGTSAQNAVLYDGVPVYNLGHLAGLFSTFNDDALGGATLYKGLIPATLGGASAAVFDITGRTGNPDAWHGGVSIGLLSAKAMAEGPLFSEKASLLVAARRSYADLLLKALPKYRSNTLYFYDLNAKVRYAPNVRNTLCLSFFMGHDRTALEDMADLRWSNLALSLQWQHTFCGATSSRTTLLYSDYTTDNAFDLLGLNAAFTGGIRQGGLRQDFHLQGRRLRFDIGLQSMLMQVKSAEWQQVKNHEREQRRSWESAVWANATMPLGSRLTASAGLRLTVFSALGGSLYYGLNEQGDIIRLFTGRDFEFMQTYFTPEPRLSLRWQLHPQASIKAGYSRTSQNIHALRGQDLSTPFDRYTASSNLLRPEVADQVSLGIFAMTPSQTYDFSLEGYYRSVSDVLDYRDGKSFSSAIELERLVLSGRGRGYGAELCLRKNEGRLTGWLAYTLSWSQTRIPGINGGRWYTAGNDRRHDVDLVVAYRLSPRWTLNATWLFNSGQAFTAPSGKYVVEDNYIYYYAERNGYRAPAYHRLDVGATWSRQRRHIRHELNLSIYNLYNHYNPFLIHFEDSDNGARTRAVQYSLFGILPSIAYTLRF